MINLNQLQTEANEMRDELVAVRRDFHEHPELGFEETRTSGIVAAKLNDLGYEVQTGVGKTGVVGILEGGKPDTNQTLLVRFDMDALPIHELVNVPFKSTVPNKMHACGHDAHTSIGLGVARMMMKHRDLWGGTVKFVFQPAEEGVGGARAMIADGVLENPKPTRALSMHVWSMEEVGKIGMTDGATMAAPDKFSITVKGRGTHGATPHEGLDPIVASAYIVTALQTIVTRSVNPLEPGVVTIGSIHGGSAANVIPDEVVMQGTIRAFSDEVMNTLRERIRSIVEHFGKSMGMVASVEFSGVDVPATVNDKAMAAVVRGVAKELVGEANVTSDHRTMGSEDCSYFLKAAPGAYVFVGAGNKAKGINEPHHSPRFQIDEDCLPISVALMTASAIKMLNE